MTFWSKIASLAAHKVDEADCTECPVELPGQDPAFSTAVTALGAKLAKADGRADASEYEAFSQVFHSEERSEGNIRRLYNLAQQTTAGYESYARRLAKRYRGCPQLLEDVLDGLFHIAGADGVVTARELEYLDSVGELFGLSPLVLRRMRATHFGLAKDDPYAVLGALPDASDQDLRATWRSLLSEAHPDRARSRGLPNEFIELAERKAAAINAAYDQIQRERRELVGAGA